MAELLICWHTRGVFKKGDVVTVKPDGHPWGSDEENSDLFRIVKLPGVPEDELVEAVKPWVVHDILADPDAPSNPKLVAMREWQFKLSGLPTEAQRQRFLRGRSVSAARKDLPKMLHNKRRGRGWGE